MILFLSGVAKMVDLLNAEETEWLKILTHRWRCKSDADSE